MRILKRSGETEIHAQRLLKFFTLLAVILLQSFSAFAQDFVIKGKVTDAETKEALAYASVFFPGSPYGTTTDINGNYTLRYSSAYTKIRFSCLGYKTIIKDITPQPSQTLNIKLQTDSKEIEVKAKKRHYRNKDNPAVELIREAVAHREQNRMANLDYVQYEQYEKLQFSIINTKERLQHNIFLRRYKFLTDNLDTVTVAGKALLPVYLQEQVTQNYIRRNPSKKKTYITADKKITFKDFIDNDGANTYLKYLYDDINIYDNNIYVVTNQFLSPIADLAPTFYRYYITDTLVRGNDKVVELSFYPRNKTDMLFQGKIYITLDGSFAVTRVDMDINHEINLNWVQNLHIMQDYDKSADKKYYLTNSSLKGSFGISKSSRGGIYGERLITFRNFVANKPQPDSTYQGPDVVMMANAADHPDTALAKKRPDTLGRAEILVYKNMDSLQSTRSFKRTLDILTLFIAGFKKAGPYVEIGPVNTFYSFNPVEGFRLRFGGRTTPDFSKSLYFESYIAYGFKDTKVKYYVGGAYSFNHGYVLSFPLNILRANYQQDTKIPGQELQYIQEDNFVLSFKRGVNDKWLYNKTWNVDYLREFPSHFSYDIGVKNWEQSPAGGLQFLRNDNGGIEKVPSVITSEAFLELRWAPGERFYQGKLYRVPLPNEHPILTLRFTEGAKGIMNSQYNYQRYSLNLFQRIFFSQLGYADLVLEGGYLAGQVPFPLLYIHRANQTYALQLESYNMMNFLEFVSDHYASAYLDYTFNGFFFNKIPLIKHLKWREHFSVKMLYGGVRDENRPDKNPNLLQFPTDSYNQATTFTLDKEPYIEGSVGIANIFNFFRVDLVKRFTYLDNPHVSSLGIRGRFKFDF